MLRLATFFLLFSVTTAFFGRASTCVSEFRNLDGCMDDNPDCSSCAILGPLANPFSFGFCDTANDSMCNAFNCCTPCETEFETYETCFADLVSRVTFGNCEIDCDRAPTPSPTTLAEAEDMFNEEMEEQGCMKNFADFAACAAQNPLECGSCLISNIPDDPMEVGFCTSATDAICGFGTCCEPCDAEFVLFDQCFEVIVEEVTRGSCVIDCDDFVPTEPLDLGCIDRMTDYTKCVADNPIECAMCAVQNFPSDPREDGFCEVATDSICGFSKCCTSCEEKFQEFDECFEDWVGVATIGQCQIDCDTYKGSAGGSGGAGNCVQKLQSYSDCVLKNPIQCGLCAINNLPSPGDDGFCEAAAESVCGFGDCCNACATQFDEFDECFEDFASTVTLGDCQIDCDATNPKEWFGARKLRGDTSA